MSITERDNNLIAYGTLDRTDKVTEYRPLAAKPIIIDGMLKEGYGTKGTKRNRFLKPRINTKIAEATNNRVNKGWQKKKLRNR